MSIGSPAPKRADWTAALFSAWCIVMVVVCHLYGTEFISGPFDLFAPYSWFLEGFAFVSGYLYRDGTEDHLGAYLLRRVRRMLVPLLVINASLAVTVHLLRHLLGFTFGSDLSLYSLLFSPFVDCHDLGWNVPMWFVAPFCLAQCAHVVVRRIVSGALRALSGSDGAQGGYRYVLPRGLSRDGGGCD